MTQAGGVDLPGEVAGLVALNELVVHGWDIATASGQDYRPDEATLRPTRVPGPVLRAGTARGRSAPRSSVGRRCSPSRDRLTGRLAARRGPRRCRSIATTRVDLDGCSCRPPPCCSDRGPTVTAAVAGVRRRRRGGRIVVSTYPERAKVANLRGTRRRPCWCCRRVERAVGPGRRHGRGPRPAGGARAAGRLLPGHLRRAPGLGRVPRGDAPPGQVAAPRHARALGPDRHRRLPTPPRRLTRGFVPGVVRPGGAHEPGSRNLGWARPITDSVGGPAKMWGHGDVEQREGLPMSEVTVVRGGTIIDGTGAERATGDVAVADGRIVEIGKGLQGDRVIDATDCVVAPGFIDIHTHYDAQVFWDPALTPSCYHGVTTVVAGNCGFSIAPTYPDRREQIARTLEKVEDMDPESLAAGIPWDFVTFPEYLGSVEQRGLGPQLRRLHRPHAAAHLRDGRRGLVAHGPSRRGRRDEPPRRRGHAAPAPPGSPPASPSPTSAPTASRSPAAGPTAPSSRPCSGPSPTAAAASSGSTASTRSCTSTRSTTSSASSAPRSRGRRC